MPASSRRAIKPKIRRRLETELIIWLATVNPDGRPLVVPVWFLWDANSFLIYSLPGLKVQNIERSPKVELHLNSTADGDDVVRIDGAARIPKRQPPAFRVPAYVKKYAALIKSYGWTPESFSADYRIPIRIDAEKIR
jgi:PPOX class probable F420-dependent enzyme